MRFGISLIIGLVVYFAAFVYLPRYINTPYLKYLPYLGLLDIASIFGIYKFIDSDGNDQNQSTNLVEQPNSSLPFYYPPFPNTSSHKNNRANGNRNKLKNKQNGNGNGGSNGIGGGGTDNGNGGGNGSGGGNIGGGNGYTSQYNSNYSHDNNVYDDEGIPNDIGTFDQNYDYYNQNYNFDPNQTEHYENMGPTVSVPIENENGKEPFYQEELGQPVNHDDELGEGEEVVVNNQEQPKPFIQKKNNLNAITGNKTNVNVNSANNSVSNNNTNNFIGVANAMSRLANKVDEKEITKLMNQMEELDNNDGQNNDLASEVEIGEE